MSYARAEVGCSGSLEEENQVWPRELGLARLQEAASLSGLVEGVLETEAGAQRLE